MERGGRRRVKEREKVEVEIKRSTSGKRRIKDRKRRKGNNMMRGRKRGKHKNRREKIRGRVKE